MKERISRSGDPLVHGHDVQTAAATQLDEDGASSAVSPTLGAAVVLAKYPTLLLVVLAVGVLSRDIEPPLDYAIPDSSPAANSSARAFRAMRSAPQRAPPRTRTTRPGPPRRRTACSRSQTTSAPRRARATPPRRRMRTSKPRTRTRFMHAYSRWVRLMT